MEDSKLKQYAKPIINEINRLETTYGFEGRPIDQYQPLMISLDHLVKFRDAFYGRNIG